MKKVWQLSVLLICWVENQGSLLTLIVLSLGLFILIYHFEQQKVLLHTCKQTQLNSDPWVLTQLNNWEDTCHKE